MKVHEALNAAALRLAVESDTPRLDAELLMAEALDLSRVRRFVVASRRSP